MVSRSADRPAGVWKRAKNAFLWIPGLLVLTFEFAGIMLVECYLWLFGRRAKESANEREERKDAERDPGTKTVDD
jgi:hypothetical protein